MNSPVSTNKPNCWAKLEPSPQRSILQETQRHLLKELISNAPSRQEALELLDAMAPDIPALPEDKVLTE